MLKEFTVIIEPDVEGTGFSATVPALPGCGSQGETLEEALKNIREATELYVGYMKDHNIPLPKIDVNVELKKIKIAV